MDIFFETNEQWDGNRGGLLFWATADGVPVRCFVSRDTVHRSYGGSGSKEDELNLFRTNRSSFEIEAAALIRNNRLTPVEGQTFKEAQILSGRVRHRPFANPIRRITADELLGSTIAKYAEDLSWWRQASGQPVENITVYRGASNIQFVDIAFTSEKTAADFDHKMSKFGVRTFRLDPAG